MLRIKGFKEHMLPNIIYSEKNCISFFLKHNIMSDKIVFLTVI